MATQDWWDAVKHEVRDMLVPRQAKRMATPPSGEALDVDRRQADNIPPTIYPPVLSAPSSTVSIDTNLVLAPTSTASPTTTTTPLVAATTTTSPPARTTSARPTATGDSSGNDSGDSGEMSVAAKAGIVIGVLGGILVVFLIVYLIVSARRRKLERRRQQIEDDEKINGPFADSAAIRPTPAPNKAPRLSLRPVTQFLPNFNSQSQAERRASRGIALTLNPVSNSSPLTRPNNGGSAWERPTLRSTMASPSGDHPRNPFHDKHELPDEPVSPISSMGSFDHRVGMATTTDSIPEPVSPIIGDDDDDDGNSHDRRQLAAGTSSNLTRKTSMRKDIPKPLDLTKPPSPLYAVPPSPAGTEYSMHSIAPGQSPGPSASAAAIAAAGGPTQSTVHRVQLDFKPTLQDEMELRAGQLVRLLHEYDDGWALCIRLDRSQQGVVPRTCLSTRPVKPRPQQGPPGPQGNPRGGPPVNPSFHFHDRPDSHNMFPPVPVAKDERWGNGSGNRNGNGNGRRSPAGGRGQGRGPAGTQQEWSGQRQWWRDEEDEQGGAGAGVGGLSPAPGQAY